MPIPDSTDLPLRCLTPDSWGTCALEEPVALLNDHAHLERKAASNALELLQRWPEPIPPENWVRVMTAVARDEVDHLAIVTRLLTRRGGQFSKHHKSTYAADLRDCIRTGQGPLELLDRLIVSALIELRSCERFAVLARVSTDPELTKLYEELWASEHGHFTVFLNLARELELQPHEVIEERWQEMLDREAEIIQRQPAGPWIHGWV